MSSGPPMSPVARKAKYESDKAARRCVSCSASLAPDVTTVRCHGCLKGNRKATYRSRGTPEKLAIARHYMASMYLSNPEVFKARAAARREQKKLDGTCIDCRAPCLLDNSRCEVHRDAYNASRRVVHPRTRRAAGRAERKEIEAYVPTDQVVDLTRVRVLRAARYLDWFTMQELTTEIMEIDDPTMRNTIAATVGRMARAGGAFERRTSRCWKRGSQYEYRITAAGIAELAGILGGTVAPRQMLRKRRPA